MRGRFAESWPRPRSKFSGQLKKQQTRTKLISEWNCRSRSTHSLTARSGKKQIQDAQCVHGSIGPSQMAVTYCRLPLGLRRLGNVSIANARSSKASGIRARASEGERAASCPLMGAAPGPRHCLRLLTSGHGAPLFDWLESCVRQCRLITEWFSFSQCRKC